jgi:hypothetical protein
MAQNLLWTIDQNTEPYKNKWFEFGYLSEFEVEFKIALSFENKVPLGSPDEKNRGKNTLETITLNRAGQ